MQCNVLQQTIFKINQNWIYENSCNLPLLEQSASDCRIRKSSLSQQKILKIILPPPPAICLFFCLRLVLFPVLGPPVSLPPSCTYSAAPLFSFASSSPPFPFLSSSISSKTS